MGNKIKSGRLSIGVNRLGTKQQVARGSASTCTRLLVISMSSTDRFLPRLALVLESEEPSQLLLIVPHSSLTDSLELQEGLHQSLELLLVSIYVIVYPQGRDFWHAQFLPPGG